MSFPARRLPGAFLDRSATAGRCSIAVIAGVGEGHTELSAFDAALHAIGTENYNLIPLSSVIPPRSRVVRRSRYQAPEQEFGHRLFVVKAEMRSAEPGAVIAAGLGWLQWGDGRGLFVEHELCARGHAPAAVEAAVAGLINASLADLARRRNVACSGAQVQMHVVSATVAARPACALALAVYQAEGWRRCSDEIEEAWR